MDTLKLMVLEETEFNGRIEKVQVFERSFAVFAEPTLEAGEGLLKLATRLGKKYGQDSILFKPFSEKYAYWYYTGSSQEGEIEKIGAWTPIIMTAYYSQLLNTKQKFQFR